MSEPRVEGEHITVQTAGDLHCPSCGETDVWVEVGRGDFYQGPEHICIACDSSFYVQGIGPVDHNDDLPPKIREAHGDPR